MNVRWRLVGLAATVFALVTACGGSSGGNQVASISDPAKPSDQQQAGDPSTPRSPDDFRDFVKCMREHGVDMPDPKTGPGGGVGIEIQGGPGNEEKVEKAQEDCRHLMPNGGTPPKLDAKQLDELRKQAKCLREHGIDMPDPDPNNPEFKVQTSGDPEKDKKAFDACGGGMFSGPPAGGPAGKGPDTSGGGR